MTEPAAIVRQALEQNVAVLYRTARYVLSDAHEAEDAAQEAAVDALRGAGRYDPSRPVGPWLAGIAYRSALARLRKKGTAMRDSEAAPAPRPELPVAVAAERAETMSALRALVSGLGVEERTAVALHYYEGLSVREVGQVQGVPHTTVEGRLKAALDRLRKGLAGAGLLAAASGALEASLRAVQPEGAPPGLVAKVHALVEGKGAARTAAKGGIAMKVVLGVLLAGMLAGGAALLFGPPTAYRPPPTVLASPPAPSGPPKREHVASIDAHGVLDGPAKEAIGYGWQLSGSGFPDAEGNLWGGSNGTRWLRASDGRIMRISSCEYGTVGFDCGKEGPIAGRPSVNSPGGYGWPCGGSAIVGRPDSGGKTDGIYQSLGLDGRLIRIWKNKDKGGRWWFEIVVGGGNAAAPRAKGQSADALAVKFKWINMPQVGLDGKLRFMADGIFYLLEEGKVTCVLGPDDYKAATEAMKSLPCEGYVGGDGTFYLGGYYYSGAGAYEGKTPGIWRVTTDGKVEPCAKNSRGTKTVDGDALTQAGWFCGPHLGRSGGYMAGRFIPPDSVFTSAHDEDLFRRIQKGRVATLCPDGEWREVEKGQLVCAGLIGPNGVAYFSYRRWEDMRLYRYTGIDFSKPTLNKLEGGGK